MKYSDFMACKKTTTNKTQVCFKALSSVLPYHVRHLHLDF